MRQVFVIIDNETGELKIVTAEDKAKAAVEKMRKLYPQENPYKTGGYRHVYEMHGDSCEEDCYCR